MGSMYVHRCSKAVDEKGMGRRTTGKCFNITMKQVTSLEQEKLGRMEGYTMITTGFGECDIYEKGHKVEEVG